MKVDGMKQVGIITLLGIVLLSGYHYYRQQTTDRLSAELRTVREQSTQQQLLEVKAREQSLLLSGAADLSSFVESLYVCAQRTGVAGHEVTTGKLRDQPQTRRSRKAEHQNAGESLKVNRLQVTLHGDFRSVAEYVRQVQELDRFKQIVRFELQTDEASLKLLMLLDLYSLKGYDE